MCDNLIMNKANIIIIIIGIVGKVYDIFHNELTLMLSKLVSC